MKFLFLSIFFISFFAYSQTDIAVGRILDMDTGKYLYKKIITISSEGKILSIRPLKNLPPHALHFPHLTFIPAFIDLHTHLFFEDSSLGESFAFNLEKNVSLSKQARLNLAQTHAQELLHSGFLTVRDLGNSGDFFDFEMSKDFPIRFISSGKGISYLGGQFYFFSPQELVEKEYTIVSSFKQMQMAIKERTQKKYEWVKFYADNEPNPSVMPLELLRYGVNEAHKNHLKVAIHAATREGMKNALKTNPETIEHAYEIMPEDFPRIKEKKIVLIPTDFAGSVREIFKVFSFNPYQTFLEEKLNARIMLAYKSKIPLAFGSDYYFNLLPYNLNFGEGTLESLIGLRLQGFSNLHILQMATSLSGKILNKNLGKIAPNFIADMIGVEGDPLEDLTVLRKKKLIIRAGKILK